MLFAQLDANGWAIIIGAFFMGSGQIVQMIIGYYREKDKIARETAIAAKVDVVAEKATIVAIKQDEAAKKVEEVAVKQEETSNTAAQGHQNLVNKLDKVEEIALKTQAFVNGATTTQLQVTSEALRKLADKTRDPKDIHAAQVAEEFLIKHIANQPKS